MKTIHIQEKNIQELRALFLDVFSNEPWFDKWENGQQVDLYIRDLIDNQNSLSFILVDDQGSTVGH
ncbi:hypothetical protein ACFSTA_02035 [Ornithinibacillus salinisoli]|uniref:GNAT family N-acetyltransferase n=1 Tax=Ornithinibacillus salinisoli TaxID=1848459 RepID=A0ABW4VU56_9BACI